MEDYWSKFWAEHSISTASEHPQFQVLRTLSKKPINEDLFVKMLTDIEEKLEINHNDVVLELCCGNGLITKHLASLCQRVVGVDFAKELVSQIDLEKYQNVSIVIEDIRKAGFEDYSFDKIVMYAGLQYLSYKETVCIMGSVISWLKNDGLFYIGDIPDRERLWNFFNTDEREKTYFDSIKNSKPIIGTWFDPGWLAKLGKNSGFKIINIHPQPNDFPYSHYRFDMVLKKSNSKENIIKE